MNLNPNAQLALDTILAKPTQGIPAWLLHPMEHTIIERLADVAQGTFRNKPVETYLAMQKNIGTGMIDQWIPTNPLEMKDYGYEQGTGKTATTGLTQIVLDGIAIDSPEAVVAHLEQKVFPEILKNIKAWEQDAAALGKDKCQRLIEAESKVQSLFGPGILKVPYGCVSFPYLRYFSYGYENYFMAYALYPEVIERDFSLQADLAVWNNHAVVQAYKEGALPPLDRLDHDMADSRGTLVDINSLDKLWFPHFTRAIAPLVKAGIKLIWHCDGNLSQMVPRLLEAGLSGFQGFQYEDGMDYERICRMKTRAGNDLLIIGGVSVTRTLPFGTPDDVRKELEWLVKHGPETGLFLGGSSSIAPGVPWENMTTLVEGLKYYRERGRN